MLENNSDRNPTTVIEVQWDDWETCKHRRIVLVCLGRIGSDFLKWEKHSSVFVWQRHANVNETDSDRCPGAMEVKFALTFGPNCKPDLNEPVIDGISHCCSSTTVDELRECIDFHWWRCCSTKLMRLSTGTMTTIQRVGRNSVLNRVSPKRMRMSNVPSDTGSLSFQTTKGEEEEKEGGTLTFYGSSFDSVHMSMAHRYPRV